MKFKGIEMMELFTHVEPNWVIVAAVATFVSLALSELVGKVRTSLIVAIWVTAVRCAWELSGSSTILALGNAGEAYFLPASHYLASWKALFWLLAPLPMRKLNRSVIHRIGLGLFVLAAAGTLGLFTNPSMGAALVVVTLPFAEILGPRRQILAEVMAVILIALTGHLTAAVVWFAIQSVRLARYNWRIAVVTCSVIAALGIYFLPAEFHDGHGRLSIYLFFWKQFHTYWSPWIGMGVGKFQIYGPVLQKLAGGESEQFWCFLHSDWGELYMQQGILGALPWLWVWAETLWLGFKKDSILFCCAVGITVLMADYFPLHTTTGAVATILCLSTLNAINPTEKEKA